MGREGLGARMEERRGVYRDLVGMPECKRPLDDLGVVGRITFRWILRR
jgi:hypothetical protein